MAVVLLVLGFGLLALYIFTRKTNPLDNIPGPKPLPLIGNTLQLDISTLYLQLRDFAKQYGSIYILHLFNKPVVVVNDHRFIYDVLVKQSADFAGRPSTFRSKIMNQELGGIGFTDPGPAHSGRRKVVHSYLKQYGSGIQKIEDITQTATDDLIHRFAEQKGTPIDVRDYLFHCVTDVIAILLIEKTLSTEEMKGMKNTLDTLAVAMTAGNGATLDLCPMLRFFGHKTYKQLRNVVTAKEKLLNDWIDAKPEGGFLNFLTNMSDNEKRRRFLETRRMQSNLAFEFFVAGVFTTSTTLTVLMNVLCHYPHV